MGKGLETVRCNLCGSKNHELVYSIKSRSSFSYKGSLSYVKCTNCGLVYTNPRPIFEKVKEQYESEDYHSDMPRDAQNYLRKTLNTNLNKLIFVEKYKQKGNILDVGSAQGFFLYVARLRGWNTFGVEISERTSCVSNDKLKLNVFCGTIEDAKFKPNFFDVITAFNLIEHLGDPYCFMLKCNSIMKKNGVLIVETPCLDSLHYRLLGKRWDAAADPGQHLYLFSKDTLRKMAEKAGFKVKALIPMTSWDSIFAKTSVNEGIFRYFLGLSFRIAAKILRKEVMITLVCEKK